MMRTLTVYPEDRNKEQALEIILKAMGIAYESAGDVEDIYNPEFVAKIRQGLKEQEEGKGTTMTPDEFKALCK